MNEDGCKAGGATEANLGQGFFTIILNISEKKKMCVYMVGVSRENVRIINQMWWNGHVWRVWVRVSNSPFDPGPDPWAPMTWSPTAILATFLQVWTHIKIKIQVRSSFPLQPVAYVEVAREPRGLAFSRRTRGKRHPETSRCLNKYLWASRQR